MSTHGFSLNQIFLWDYCRATLTSPQPEAPRDGNGASLIEALYPDTDRDVAEAAEPVRRVATLTGKGL